MCNLPFQDLDFGWGKPSRVSLASAPYGKLFVSMSAAPDGGMQVLVNLQNKEYMSIFEQGNNLLRFPNPAHVQDLLFF